MAYTGEKPADNQTIAAGPADIRDEMQGLATGQVVDAGTLQGLAPGNTSGAIPISNGNVNANLNADKLQGKTPADFAPAGWVPPVATSSSTGSMSSTDKAKLDTVATNAEVNQNAFSNVKVGSTTLQADSKTDTLEVVGGANITVTPEATNDRLTFAVSGKVPTATTADTLSQALSAALGGTGRTDGAAPPGYGLGGIGTRLAANYDLNQLKSNGWYDVSNPVNGPITEGWIKILVVCSGDTNYASQLVFSMTTGTSGTMWLRECRAGTWSSWVTIIHSGNIGSQSVNYATNADTVDGSHASAFAPSGYGLGNTGISISGVDLNTVYRFGCYWVDTSNANRPVNYGVLFCGSSTGGINDVVAQIVYGYDGNVYKRNKGGQGGAWSSWMQLATTSQIPSSQSSILFTSSGTFTVPSGITKVFVTVSGGGGGGGSGGAGGNNNHGGGGGGGGGGAAGAFFVKIPIAVTSGSNYAITVGAHGIGGAAKVYSGNGNAGAVGGTSSFGSLLSARGGNGGGAGGYGGNENWTSGGAGGSSVNSYNRGSGGAGGYFSGESLVLATPGSGDFGGNIGTRGNDGHAGGGGGGLIFMFSTGVIGGAGGNGPGDQGATGGNGQAGVYGGGGGGGSGAGKYGTSGAGGNGGDGFVLIEW